MPDHKSRPMSLEGPYENERARIDGTFTDVDRKWRKQYLKDQELSHNEPRHVNPSEKYNPIRKAYRFPLDFIFRKLEPTLVSIHTWITFMVSNQQFHKVKLSLVISC